MARITAMQVYGLLPKKNCKACGEETCMSFALKLMNREKTPFDCPNLSGAEREALIDFITPPVREVRIGSGDNEIRIGGEEVLYRHELKLFNPTALAIDISDSMSAEEIDERIEFVQNYCVERVGETLTLDALSIRSQSGDAKKFSSTVEVVSEKFSGPIVLCSLKPEVIESGLKILKDRKPLIYAATEGNWEDMLDLAKKYNAALAVYSEDIESLGNLTREISATGFLDMILDPGLNVIGNGLRNSLNTYTMIRKSAIKEVKELGYPLMAVPAVIWKGSDDKIATSFYESFIGCVFMDKFASLIIMHSIDYWAALPLLTLRQNIYTDPRTEPEVDSGMFTYGNPDENSPVLVTTNFSLTYFTVSSDLRRFNLDCYLLVVDAKGFAVDTAVATNDLNGSKIRDLIKNSGLEDKVKHKKLIIPLLASQIRGDIEDKTGWDVVVGPRDSSQIPGFLKEHWE